MSNVVFLSRYVSSFRRISRFDNFLLFRVSRHPLPPKKFNWEVVVSVYLFTTNRYLGCMFFACIREEWVEKQNQSWDVSKYETVTVGDILLVRQYETKRGWPNFLCLHPTFSPRNFKHKLFSTKSFHYSCIVQQH